MVVLDKKTVMVTIHSLQKVNSMISKKRIRNIDSYLLGIRDNDSFFIVKKVSEIELNRLSLHGFSTPLIVGEQVLPRILGPISRINSIGSFIRRKDLPMETKFRDGCVKDWHGNYHFVDIPYKRYPREEIPAPSIELKIINISDELHVISPPLQRNNSSNSIIKHVINLFLELFGSCDVYTMDLVPALTSIPTIRVNWRILPEGEYPWTRLAQLAGNLSSSRTGIAKIQEHNINTILQFRPSELVYGAGGFRGYLVFKFPTKNLFVMENVIYGNATYIFENDWEQFSQLTKAEIIENSLVLRRIEHRAGWEDKIKSILS